MLCRRLDRMKISTASQFRFSPHSSLDIIKIISKARKIKTMDQEQQNQNQGMNVAGGQPPEMGVPLSNVPEEKKHVGPLIGIIIIVVVIILGGLYFWGQKVNNVAPQENTADSMTAEKVAGQADESLNALKTQGTSDSVADIEADLSATVLNGLDAEVGSIEAQLNP